MLEKWGYLSQKLFANRWQDSIIVKCLWEDKGFLSFQYQKNIYPTWIPNKIHLHVNILSIFGPWKHPIGFQTTKHLQANSKPPNIKAWVGDAWILHCIFDPFFLEIRRNHQLHIRNLTWISSCHCINISFSSSVRVKASQHPGNSRQIPDVFGSTSARSLRYGATTLALQHHFGTQAEGGPENNELVQFLHRVCWKQTGFLVPKLLVTKYHEAPSSNKWYSQPEEHHVPIYMGKRSSGT